MRVLVTGAMGHVGFESVRQLAAAGRPVLGQYRGVFRKAEADRLDGDVVWAPCDLTESDTVRALLDTHPVSACLHSAAVPNERVARIDPLAAIRSNVEATAVLLDEGRRRGWRRLVYVSTGSVFQNATDAAAPIPEDQAPGVSNIYSTTKYCGELLTRLYRRELGFSAATVRISWVYGPPMVPDPPDPPRGPVPHFLLAAMRGEPIRLPAGADFAASFTHVADVAAGLIAALDAPMLEADVYHLGSGENYTASRVADAVRAAVPGAVIELGPGTEPWTLLTRMRGPLSGERLARDAGFQPRYSIESGIAAFADWMRAHPESYR